MRSDGDEFMHKQPQFTPAAIHIAPRTSIRIGRSVMEQC